MRFAILIAGLAGLAACSNGSTPTPPPEPFRIPVVIETAAGDQSFMAEVADDPAEREKGLMFRESMNDEHGMIFLFPMSKQQSFWMKNTLIPLDIIFIREDQTILGISENAEPKTTSPRRVPGLSQFVLELNGGLSKTLGIEAGQKVRFTAPIPER